MKVNYFYCGKQILNEIYPNNFIYLLIFLLLSCGGNEDNTQPVSDDSTISKILEGKIALLVEGTGYLILNDQDNIVYKRSGTFGINVDGYLSLDTGEVLEGFQANSNGSISATIGGLYVAGLDPYALKIAPDGLVTSIGSDDEQFYIGQVLLATFTNPSELNIVNEDMYAETLESGGPLVGVPGTVNLGYIIAESSHSIPN